MRSTRRNRAMQAGCSLTRHGSRARRVVLSTGTPLTVVLSASTTNHPMNSASPQISIEPLESRIAPAFAAAFSLADLNGANGFRLDGIDVDDFSGGSVSGAGDVNGDGFDDLLIGASRADPGGDSAAGESYVVFGHTGAFPAAGLDLATLDGINGFRIDGIDAGDSSGYSVSAAGDINGDGFDDLLIGGARADPGGDSLAGESYVVFGHAGAFPAAAWPKTT